MQECTANKSFQKCMGKQCSSNSYRIALRQVAINGTAYAIYVYTRD